MPKRRRGVQLTGKLLQNTRNGIMDVATQIKTEPVDDDCELETAVIIPTKTIIYTENDDNKAAVEAEIGLISQLEFIKSEVDVDEATLKEFREEIRLISYDKPNDECNQDQQVKKRKKEVAQKPVPKKSSKKTRTSKETEPEKKKKLQKKQEKKKQEKLFFQRSFATIDNKSKKVELQPLEIVVEKVRMAKCHFCDFQLTSRNRSIVKEHMRIHTGVTPHTCMHCPQKFITRRMLMLHIQRDHPTKNKYKCPLCRLWVFTKKHFEAHELKCVKRRSFECHLCKFQLRNVQMHRVKHHMRKEHTGEEVFQCDHCDQAFVTKGMLRKHVQLHPGVVPFKCSKCETRFTTEEKLKNHEKYCFTRRRFECHLCQYSNAKLTFEGMRAHMRKHTGEKPFQCQYCKKFYPRIEALAHHIQRHRDLFNFKCAQCHRRCFNADDLKEHEDKCRKRRYECHLCGFTKFGLSYNKFRRHFALKHIGERCSKCMGCTETFSSIALLARHLTESHPKFLALICPNCHHRSSSRAARDLHQKNCMKRRIECYICKLTSRNLSTLRSHMVAKHTGEAKFQCHLCPKKYLIETNLKIHIKSHSKIGLLKCDYCDKLFSDIKYKKKHEFRCKQVFECYLCKETFPSFAILKGIHVRTHLGAKPYNCTHCTKSFASIRTYTLHVLDAHVHQYKFECKNCNGIIKKKQDVAKHQRSCLKPIRQSVGIVYFKCSRCGLGLPRVPELRQHILNAECAEHPKKVRAKNK